MDDEPAGGIEALMEERGIGTSAPLETPVTETIRRHSVDLGRYYAEHRSTLSAYEAALESCRSVFDPDEYLRLMDHLQPGSAMVKPVLDLIIDICEIVREMISTIQPRELAERESLDIAKLAEAWATDLSAWIPPAQQPTDYWVTIAGMSILEKAGSARTDTGKRVKLEQAVLAIRRVQSDHLQAQDMPASASCDELVNRLHAGME